MIWVCILCRKKQELLSKTGQWINKGPVDPIMCRIEADMQGGNIGGPGGNLMLSYDDGGTVLQTNIPSDKRPKLERAHSAAEKENLPLLQRSGSVLRRQYSQQQEPRRMSTSDSGVDVSQMVSSNVGQHRLRQPQIVQINQQEPQLYPDEDPQYYRDEIEGLMRQHPHLVHPHQRMYVEDQDQLMDVQPSNQHSNNKKHKRNSNNMQGKKSTAYQQHPSFPGQPYQSQQSQLQQQHSFSSSEEELRSTPECGSCDEIDRDNDKGKKYFIVFLMLNFLQLFDFFI